MGWETLSETPAASVGPSGMVEWEAGDSLEAADLTHNMSDAQGQAYMAMPSGVLEGGGCTADGLTVTVPSGTRYLARNVWHANGAATVSVPDGTTTYIWGCADGVLRTTASTTPPSGWSSRDACILCRVVASGGTAVVDISAQQRGRVAVDHQVFEGSGSWAPTPDVIGSSGVAHVPDGHQLMLMDTLAVYGSLSVRGKLRVV